MLEAGDDVVRLSPPLVVDSDDVDTAARIFSEAVAAVAADPQRAHAAASKWGNIDDGEVDG